MFIFNKTFFTPKVAGVNLTVNVFELFTEIVSGKIIPPILKSLAATPDILIPDIIKIVVYVPLQYVKFDFY